MKYFVQIVLVAVMVLAVGAGASRAESWKVFTDSKGIEWEYEEIEAGKTCQIRSKDKQQIKGEIAIPGKVTDNGAEIKVVKIADRAFYNCAEEFSVAIPDGVEAIGIEAFKWCSEVTAVSIPNSVSVIGQSAFYGCTKVKSVNLSGAKDIGQKAFRTSGLTEVTIPDGVKSIASETFRNCKDLKSVTLPEGVESIGSSAFSSCSSLTTIELPGSVKAIGADAFSYCTSLETFTFPPLVNAIERHTLFSCSALKSVTISSGVKTLGDYVFGDCDSLERFVVDKDNQTFTASADGVLFSKDKRTLILYPLGKEEMYYSVPDGVKAIEEYAFEYCRKLKGVALPESLQSIGGSAFYGCESLTEITIPEGVTAIRILTFAYCSKLQSVTLPEKLETIGFNAFLDCSSLKEITIPHHTRHIEESVFLGCSSFEAIYWLPDVSIKLDPFPFDDVYYVTLYVRKGEKEKIKKAKLQMAEFGGFKDTVEGHLVTFADGDNPLFERLVMPNGRAKQPASPKKEGYTFAGWMLDGNPYNFDTPVTQDIKLVAKWDTIYFTVTFDSNGGSAVPEQKVASGEKAKEPASPTREGYRFAGWMLDGNPYNFATPVTQDLKLVAEWERIYFTVTFVSNGGPAVPEQKVASGEKAKKPDTLSREGYRFAGWMLDKKLYDFNTPVTQDLKLAAEWERIYFMVRFDSNGGPEVPEQKVAWGEKAKEPDTLTREGYRFAGWMLDGKQPYNFDTPVTENIKLVAKWEARTAVESELLAAARVAGNPVGDALALEGVAAAERVEVYSVRGAAVASQALRGEARVELNADGWASGVYLVRLVARDGARTLRFVKL